MADNINTEEFQRAVDSITQSLNGLSTFVGGRNVPIGTSTTTVFSNASDEVKKFKDSVKSASKSLKAELESLGKNVLNQSGGMSKYSSSIKGVGKAADQLASNFGILGFVVGKVIKLFTGAAERILELNDSALEAYDSLSKFGAAGRISTDEILDFASNVGFTGKETVKFTTLMREAGSDVLLLGNSASSGYKNLMKMSAQSNEVIAKFSQLGITNEELVKNTVRYVQLQRASGMQLQQYQTNQQLLAKTTLQYTRYLLELSDFSGKEVEDIQRKQQAARAEIDFQTRQMKLEDEARRLQEQGNVQAANDLRAEKKRNEELQDIAITLGLTGNNLAAINSMIATGNFNELSRSFATGIPEILDFIKSVQKGKKAPIELAQVIADANARNRQIFGEAIIQNKELAESVAYNTETVDIETRFRGKSVESMLEEAKRAKEERQKEEKESNDRRLKARAAQIEVEKNAQKLSQNFTRLSDNLLKVTPLFESFMKAMNGLVKFIARSLNSMGFLTTEQYLSVLTEDNLREEFEKLSKDRQKIQNEIITISSEPSTDPESHLVLNKRREELLKSDFKKREDQKELNKELVRRGVPTTTITDPIPTTTPTPKIEPETPKIEPETPKIEPETPPRKRVEGKVIKFSDQPVETKEETTDYLKRLAMLESGGKKDAQSTTSTAKGMFQFTEDTWKDVVGQMGKDWSLDDRTDIQKSTEAVKFLTDRNRQSLKQNLNRTPSGLELYYAHFLGSSGASNFIKELEKNPGQLAPALFPNAANANKNIFYKKIENNIPSDPRTLNEVNELFKSKYNKIDLTDPTLPSSISDIQAKFGGIFSGPLDGYKSPHRSDMTMHQTELIQPLNSNSLLQELATTNATEFKTNLVNSNNNQNNTLIPLLIEKLDQMIMLSRNNNDIQENILRYSIT